MNSNSDALGPGFDTGTLIRPTQRKLVTCWMEEAGARTLILPRVWEELTTSHRASARFNAAAAWRAIAERPDAPFQWVAWTDEHERRAEEIRSRFTQACFPKHASDQIDLNSDAVIVSQALALGTDVLVTSDVNTIDHYEINLVVEQTLGMNAGFVVTLDDALQRVFRGGEAAQRLLVLALSTIAPAKAQRWSIDEAFAELNNLRAAMTGAGLRQTAIRLETRWEQCRDLAAALEEAQDRAEKSTALAFERMRAAWHRQGKPSVKDALLAPSARTDSLTPARGNASPALE